MLAGESGVATLTLSAFIGLDPSLHFGFDFAITLFLGLVLGSFCTALIYRTPRDLSWGMSLSGKEARVRSACPHCGHVLGALDLFPVFSWLLLRGRCRFCSQKISPIYLFAELFVLFFALLFFFMHGLTLPVLAVIFALPFFTALFFIDLQYKVLPNKLVLSCLVMGAAYIWALHGVDVLLVLPYQLLGAVFFGGIFWFLGFLMSRLLKKDALGFGDVKFAAVCGFWLGPLAAGYYMFIAGLIGVALGLIWRWRTGDSVFPFGPSLILSFLCLLVFPSSLFP